MIKINKINCPPELTAEQRKILTDQYIMDGKSVWKQSYIEQGLLISSHEKCVYCECKLNVESKYMEVEHFHDKKTYPYEVVNWGNLLPSCKRCNGHKANFDTKKFPFINPAEMEPRDHLILNNFRFFPISIAGENTIEELLLNDYAKLVTPRFEITNVTLNVLETIYTDTINYTSKQPRSTRSKNRIVSAIDNLMTEATAKSEYSATVATVLINNTQFQLVNEILCKEGLWNEELQQKLKDICANRLDTDLERAVVYKRKEIFN